MFLTWLERRVAFGRPALVGVLVGLIVVMSHSAVAAPKAKQIPFWNDSEEASEFDADHSTWDSLLKKYVIKHDSGINRFDYDSVSSADKARLRDYIKLLEQMDPRQMAKDRQKPYWLNLFNASLVFQILESKPDESIKEISERKLRKKKRLTIALQKLSLDDIEHGILRPIFQDPRLHFALVGGTLGSANILSTAFTAENTDGLLNQNTKDFLAHSRGMAFNGERVVLSSIFKWYAKDFGENFEQMAEFLAQHLPEKKKRLLQVASNARYDYDWNLNKP